MHGLGHFRAGRDNSGCTVKGLICEVRNKPDMTSGYVELYTNGTTDF